MKYWIRRRDKVHGPFDLDQITKGLDNGKIIDQDSLGSSESGPWRAIAEIRHKFQRTPAPPAREQESAAHVSVEQPLRSTSQQELTATIEFDRHELPFGILGKKKEPAEVYIDGAKATDFPWEGITTVRVAEGPHSLTVRMGDLSASVEVAASRTKPIRVYADLVLDVNRGGWKPTHSLKLKTGRVPRYTLRGKSGDLFVFDDYVQITPNNISDKVSGTSSEILFKAIEGVQVTPNATIEGSIVFRVASRGVVNTVTYKPTDELNALADEIRTFVMEALSRSTDANPVASSAADELAKLADLLSKGLITTEEFSALKAKLI